MNEQEALENLVTEIVVAHGITYDEAVEVIRVALDIMYGERTQISS